MKLPDITPIAVALLSVIIPVFIFAVTLLGNAIERAKKEEERLKEEQENKLNIKIAAIEAQVGNLKETNNHDDIAKQLAEYKETKKKFANEFKKIKEKYSRLEFNGSILIPGAFFLTASLLSEISKIFTTNTTNMLACWFGAVFFLLLGIHKLSKNLILVQEISASSDELQSRKMTEAFKAALIAIEQEKEEILNIKFIDFPTPYTCKPNTEITINFRVSLIQGKFLKDVETWFYIPDAFTLISPNEESAWRQGSDFIVPNIRTIRCKHGDLKGRVYQPSSIKIKTPDKPGKYEILYSDYSENSSMPEEKLTIIVKE